MKKILGIIVSLFFLNLTAADTSADEELADRLHEVSQTFKNSLEDTTGKTKDFTQQEKLNILPFYTAHDNEHAQSGILDIIRNAHDNTPASLQEATKQHLDAIDDTNMRGQAAIDILKAANFFEIKPIMQAAAQGVASYLKTSESLAKFNKSPEQFIDEEINLSRELQDMVLAALLEPVKLFFTKPKTLTALTDKVVATAYSPDGKRLASTSDNTIKIWNPQTGELVHTLEDTKKGHLDSVNAIAYSPDGKQLASSDDNTIILWNLETDELVHILKDRENGHTDWVTAIAYSPDGKQLASASADETVKLWNLEAGKPVHTFRGHTDGVTAIAYSPDGKQLASGSADNTIILWNLETDDPVHTLTHTNSVSAVAYSPDGKHLASSAESDDNNIKIWDPQTGELVHTLKDINKGHTGEVTAIAYSPDGKHLASASDDNTITLWNLETGEPVHTFRSYTDDWPVAITYSPDGKQLASVTRDNIVMLWNISIEQIMKEIDLAQALYIYYRLKGTLNPVDRAAGDSFKEMHNTLPKEIKDTLEKIIGVLRRQMQISNAQSLKNAGEPSCTTK